MVGVVFCQQHIHTHILQNITLPLNFVVDVHNWLFPRLNSSLKSFMQKEQWTLTEKLTIGGRVSFSWIMQSLTPSVWSKLISLGWCRVFIPLQKIVTISGVLGDLINYHSLHSPYDTQYCEIFTKKGNWVDCIL